MILSTYVDSSVLRDVRKSRRTSDVNKYIPKKCKTATYQRIFLVRACRIWKSLVDELDFSSMTIASLKSVLFNYSKTSVNRAFARDVTAAILVSQNNEMAAILVSQTNPMGL